MNTPHFESVMDKAAKVAVYYADQIIDGHYITENDREDLIQECLIILFHQWPNYSPEKSAPFTYMRMVLSRRVHNLRNRYIQKAIREEQTKTTLEMDYTYSIQTPELKIDLERARQRWVTTDPMVHDLGQFLRVMT